MLLHVYIIRDEVRNAGITLSGFGQNNSLSVAFFSILAVAGCRLPILVRNERVSAGFQDLVFLRS